MLSNVHKEIKVKVLIFTGICHENLEKECQTYAVNTFMPEKEVAGI
jgi:hypothetical protein